MKRLTLLLGVAILFMAAAGHAQTYKPDFSTKLVLPSGGTDPTNVFTITSGTLTGALNWTLPDSAGALGNVLVTDGAGHLGWINPATDITLAGDITGSGSSTAIASTAGPHIVAALNSSAVAKSLNADALNYDATLHVASNQLGVDLTHANTWSGKVTVNTGGANGFQYVDGNQAANAVLISDASGNAAWSTLSSIGVTTATGTAPIKVNGDNAAHAGAITISATTGSLTSTSSTLTVTGTGNTLGANINAELNLGNANTWTGDQSLPADATQGNNLVSAINDATASTLNADPIKHDATLKVASNQIGVDLTHANTWSGTQTLGGVAMTSASPTALASNTENWALSASNSYFLISASSAVNLTGITGGADGRAIVLVNNGSNAITLVNDDGSGSDNGSNSAPANRFNLPGGNLIMAANGTVTLVYDGTSTNHRWRAVAIQ